eukprot:c36979_g1_i1 orf=187-657(+)
MGKSSALLCEKLHPDGGIKKFSWFPPCSKSSGVHEPVKRSLVKKGKELSDSVSQESIAHLAAGVDAKDGPSCTVHPAEPVEVDRPIRCPQPEPGIIHDGRLLKERLPITVKTIGDFTFLTQSEYQSLLKRQRRLSSDRLIFPSASAPEHSICHLLE